MKLATLIADCALRHPDREVMVCGGRRLSFGELNSNANKLADAYVARGMQAGDRIEFQSAGAYTWSYAAVCFNGIPPLKQHVI